MKADVRDSVSRHAPMMKGMIGKMASQAVSLLAQENEVQRNSWVHDMFARADKDASGSLTFDEFARFFREDAREERSQREAQLREAVAENIDQHAGKIDVKTQSGHVTQVLK